MTHPTLGGGTPSWIRRGATAAGLWAGAFPGILALLLVWTAEAPISRTPAQRWTWTLLILAAWLGLGLAYRAVLRERTRTLTNVVSALREGDYSVRAGGGPDDLGRLADEINALSGGLREERLASKEAGGLVHAVIEEIGAGLFAFDGDDGLVLANRRGSQWLGRRPEDLLGQDAEALGLAACLAGPERQVLDLDLPRGPGRYDVRRNSFRSSGRPHRVVVLHDLTRALADEQRHAWKRMAQVLRHEINNSLAPIRSVAVMLRDGARRETRPEHWETDLQEGLELIVGRTDALGRIIEAYRQLTRLPAPEHSMFSVTEWVGEAVRAEERGSIQLEAGAETLLSADRGQVDQLLLNLLRNAVDAAAETGGDVTVTWEVGRGAGARLTVLVVDSGPGLSGQENLFVPFFSTKEGGSGIGLALSRQIAEAHGGSLTLENRERARGCVARLQLPLSPPRN